MNTEVGSVHPQALGLYGKVNGLQERISRRLRSRLRRGCPMSEGEEANFLHVIQVCHAGLELQPFPDRPRTLRLCQGNYSCAAGLAASTSLKLARYCRKTRIQRTEATSAGAMLAGASVRWNARMLYSSAARIVSARGTK